MPAHNFNDRRQSIRKDDPPQKRRRQHRSQSAPRSRSVSGRGRSLSRVLELSNLDSWGDRHESLPLAIKEGNEEKLQQYLKNNINETGRINESLIHACGKDGAALGIVKMLVKYPGVNIDHTDSHDWSSLHQLCYNYCGPDCEAIIKLLLDQGANIDLRTAKGATALHHAIQKDQKELVSLLIALRADVNIADCDGKTPLHCAIQKGQKELAFILMESKADVNATDHCGFTALHFASRLTDNFITDIAKELIRHGAIMGLKNKNGETAMDIGNKMGNIQFVRVFEEKAGGKGIVTGSQFESEASLVPSSASSSPSHQRHRAPTMTRLEAIALDVRIELDRSRGILTHLEVLEDKIYEKINEGRIADRLRDMEYELGLVD